MRSACTAVRLLLGTAALVPIAAQPGRMTDAQFTTLATSARTAADHTAAPAKVDRHVTSH